MLCLGHSGGEWHFHFAVIANYWLMNGDYMLDYDTRNDDYCEDGAVDGQRYLAHSGWVSIYDEFVYQQ